MHLAPIPPFLSFQELRDKLYMDLHTWKKEVRKEGREGVDAARAKDDLCLDYQEGKHIRFGS